MIFTRKALILFCVFSIVAIMTVFSTAGVRGQETLRVHNVDKDENYENDLGSHRRNKCW